MSPALAALLVLMWLALQAPIRAFLASLQRTDTTDTTDTTPEEGTNA